MKLWCCYVPNLRFPHEGEWIKYKLKEISKIYDGTHQTPDYKKEGIRFVSVEDIKNLYSSNKFISKENYKRDFKIVPEKGDILMTRIGDIGTPAIVDRDEPLAYYVSLALIKPKNLLDNASGKQLIQTPSFRHELWKKTIHVAFPKKINKDEIGECACYLPDLVNQKEIGNFLRLLDKRIETQNKIIEELQSLRKAIYYEQIKGAKKEEMMISDICDIGRGRVISQQEIAKQNNPIYPVFSSQTLNNGIMGYLDNYDFDGEYITWTTDGANAGTIFYHNGKFNCTNVCGTLKTNSEKVIPYYLFLALSHEAKRYVSTNLGNPKLMNGTMAKIKIKVPSIVVQKTVVNGSMILDRLIDIETKILNALSSQKSYFLANLFI